MAGAARFWRTLLGRPSPVDTPAGAATPVPSTQPASSLIDSSVLPAATEGFYILRACAQGPQSELYQARVAGSDRDATMMVDPAELRRLRELAEARRQERDATGGAP